MDYNMFIQKLFPKREKTSSYFLQSVQDPENIYQRLNVAPPKKSKSVKAGGKQMRKPRMTYELNTNQRQAMIDDYQKRIQLLRRSLGRGHLDHVPDTSISYSHQSIGMKSSKRGKKRLSRSKSTKSKKSSKSGLPINLVVKNNYNGCNFYQ